MGFCTDRIQKLSQAINVGFEETKTRQRSGKDEDERQRQR